MPAFPSLVLVFHSPCPLLHHSPFMAQPESYMHQASLFLYANPHHCLSLAVLKECLCNEMLHPMAYLAMALTDFICK